jgi:hypothetical protein
MGRHATDERWLEGGRHPMLIRVAQRRVHAGEHREAYRVLHGNDTCRAHWCPATRKPLQQKYASVIVQFEREKGHLSPLDKTKN